MGPVGIVWPDMEAAFVEYMGSALAERAEPYASGVVVSARRGDAARQVVVRDDGGSWVGDVRATVSLGLTVLATSLEEVADLANLVVALVGAWPDGKPVCAVRDLTRPYRVADESGVPQMYATAELLVRGIAL